MNLKVGQFRNKFVSGLVFAVLAFALSACSQAPNIASNDDYSSVGGYGWDQTQSSSGGLSVYPANAVIGLSSSIQIAGAGGSPPYVYTIVGGSGNLNPDTGYFQASAMAGSVQIEVRDLRGNIGYSNISVSSGAGSNQGGVGSGALNYSSGLVSIAMSPSSCTAGGLVSGSVQNQQGVTQVACTTRASFVSATTTVVAEATVTQGGLHTSNPVCPSGFTSVGTVPDCFGNSCSGVQSLCAKFATANSVSQYLANFYVTNSGLHNLTGPGCPTGYMSVGTVADCGGNSCSGYQNFCRSLNSATN